MARNDVLDRDDDFAVLRTWKADLLVPANHVLVRPGVDEGLLGSARVLHTSETVFANVENPMLKNHLSSSLSWGERNCLLNLLYHIRYLSVNER